MFSTKFTQVSELVISARAGEISVADLLYQIATVRDGSHYVVVGLSRKRGFEVEPIPTGYRPTRETIYLPLDSFVNFAYQDQVKSRFPTSYEKIVAARKKKVKVKLNGKGETAN